MLLIAGKKKNQEEEISQCYPRDCLQEYAGEYNEYDDNYSAFEWSAIIYLGF